MVRLNMGQRGDRTVSHCLVCELPFGQIVSSLWVSSAFLLIPRHDGKAGCYPIRGVGVEVAGYIGRVIGVCCM